VASTAFCHDPSEIIFSITDAHKEKVAFAGPYFITGQGWIEPLHLDRHIPAQPSVMGRPDLTHPGQSRSADPAIARQQHPASMP
jgi:hypothetical protein